MFLILKFVFLIVLGAHYLICIWIWIGNQKINSQVPWVINNPQLGTGVNLYVFVFYWVFTIITTVGYGDFTGGTTVEYATTIGIEFVGLICFTVLTLLVNQLVGSGLTYEKFISDKF